VLLALCIASSFWCSADVRDAAITAAICRQQKSFVACDSPSNLHVVKRLEGLGGQSWGDDFAHRSSLPSDMPLFHPHTDYDASALALDPQSPWK